MQRTSSAGVIERRERQRIREEEHPQSSRLQVSRHSSEGRKLEGDGSGGLSSSNEVKNPKQMQRYESFAFWKQKDQIAAVTATAPAKVTSPRCMCSSHLKYSFCLQLNFFKNFLFSFYHAYLAKNDHKNIHTILTYPNSITYIHNFLTYYLPYYYVTMYCILHA